MVLKGHGSEQLLRSYSPERRPVAQCNLDAVDFAFANATMPILSYAVQRGPAAIIADTSEGSATRAEMKVVFDKCGWVVGLQPNTRLSSPPCCLTIRDTGPAGRHADGLSMHEIPHHRARAWEQ